MNNENVMIFLSHADYPTKMNNLLVLALMIASCLADGGGFATNNNDYSGGRLGEGLGEGRGDGLGKTKNIILQILITTKY